MLDIFGNDIGGQGGYETEEEKRRRLEREAEATNQPVTQKITFNPDGTQQMTISGSPQALSAANPNTPTVTGPVAPDDVFKRMQTVESGNRDYTATGAPVTSSAGAMFRNQVMPATAANPGFGVRPAQSQTPEEYNRVGQEYYQALLKHFGGDQAKAVAAYNAGPGRVQQNVQSNAGQLNPQQLPQETQGYLQKVLGPVLNAVVPSAQAAPVPTAQPQPGAQPNLAINTPGAVNNRDAYRSMPAAPAAPVAPVNPAAPVPAAPAMEQAGPSTAAMAPEAWAERLNTARQDDRQLASLAYDPNTPQYIREEASGDLYKRLKSSKEEAAAKEKLNAAIATGDMRGLDRGMKTGNEEGSWLKYLLYGFIDPNMAKNERQKLFPDEGAKWIDFTSPDGKQNGMIQIGQNGLPLKGMYADGKKLSSEELINYSQGVGKGEHFETGLVDNATGVGGYTRAIVNGREVVRDANNRVITDPTVKSNLRKVGVEGTQAEQMDARREKAALDNLKSRIANPTPEQIYQAYRNAGVSPKRIEAVMGLAPGTLSAQGGPAINAPTGGPTAVRAANAADTAVKTPSAYEQPVQEQGELDSTFKARLKNWENKQKLLTKDAESFREKRTDIKQQLDNIRQGIDIIDSGNYNLGPQLSVSGAGPLPGVQQFVGSLVGTEDSANTNILKGLISRQGLEGIKNSMGPAISNFDVQTWMKSNPIQENSSPEAIKNYLAKLYNALYNHAEAARLNAVEMGMINPKETVGEPLNIDSKTGKPKENTGFVIIKREKIND